MCMLEKIISYYKEAGDKVRIDWDGEKMKYITENEFYHFRKKTFIVTAEGNIQNLRRYTDKMWERYFERLPAELEDFKRTEYQPVITTLAMLLIIVPDIQITAVVHEFKRIRFVDVDSHWGSYDYTVVIPSATYIITPMTQQVSQKIEQEKERLVQLLLPYISLSPVQAAGKGLLKNLNKFFSKIARTLSAKC